ncbi:MAG: transcription termination factor Rho [Deltaproteobacteria bacterium]|nr:transcription termination factor Rho [Deltaproteobacteria bacterium]
MTDTVSGVLKITKKEGGVLRDPAFSFRKQPGEIRVPVSLIREYHLVEGATVTGSVRQGGSGPSLSSVESISELTPMAFHDRRPYKTLTAIDPCERFHLAASGETSMRIVDLVAPIGKGTRGLIVAPSKAGKTTLMEHMTKAIHAGNPGTRIIVLLIDERPEEVTYFRRAVAAQSMEEHVELVEMTLAHIRTDLECGRDVVVLVDSLTRMGRVFNLKGSGTGRTLSGGMEAGALEFPRRFFGLARNIEGGGSITIIATALVETGSRMDQLIFEEFKGTGNNEIVLDRSLAEAHIFPAINILASGTRKEERLYSPAENKQLSKLRRMLADLKPGEAMESLLRLINKYPTNEELIMNIPIV